MWCGVGMRVKLFCCRCRFTSLFSIYTRIVRAFSFVDKKLAPCIFAVCVLYCAVKSEPSHILKLCIWGQSSGRLKLPARFIVAVCVFCAGAADHRKATDKTKDIFCRRASAVQRIFVLPSPFFSLLQ